MSNPYKNTPLRDFYRDLWQPVRIAKSRDDRTIVISNAHHQRPDLLASELYGDERLFWVFWQHNKDLLEDPIHDFVAGLSIKVPNRDNIQI